MLLHSELVFGGSKVANVDEAVIRMILDQGVDEIIDNFDASIAIAVHFKVIWAGTNLFEGIRLCVENSSIALR